MKNRLFFLLVFGCLLGSCQPTQTPTPDPGVSVMESNYAEYEDRGVIENPSLIEASGLVASRKNAGYLWSHNDSGDGSRIFLLDSYGKGKREFILQGAQNRDWEDMGIVSETDGSATLYLADFGDNNANYSSYALYWCKEPVVDINTPIANTISQVNKLTFTLPDGSRDMECLLVDQKTKDVFIISKRENTKRLYKIPASSFVAGGTAKAEFVRELDFSKPLSTDSRFVTAAYITGGSISADNSEILVKNYFEIYYWKRKTGETIPDALSRAPKTVPYKMEAQGEGIAFAADGNGYYTISESDRSGSPPYPAVHLYFYKKK
jgi:hypothetical protein